jgi:hypothetical protein
MTKEELRILREEFIRKYSKRRGWDAKSLTTNQMLEIAKQEEYIKPGKF